MPPATPRPAFDRIDLIPDRLGRVQRVGIRGPKATMLGFETMAGGPGDDLFSDIVADEPAAPRETAQAPAVLGPGVTDLFSDLLTEAPKPERGLFEDILMEGPAQVVGGALDAIEQAADTMEGILPLGTFDLGPEGLGGGIRHRAVDPKAERGVPEIAEPESITGGLVRGVSQFLTGFIPALKGVKAVGLASQAPKAMQLFLQSELASQIAEQLVFDPQDPRVSNLIEQFPALQNPVTEYLSAKPGDSAAEGRFKMALEGLGLGAMTGAFMGVIGAARRGGAKVAENGAESAGPAVAKQADEQAAETVAEQQGPGSPRPSPATAPEVRPLAEGQAADFLERLSRPPEAQPRAQEARPQDAIDVAGREAQEAAGARAQIARAAEDVGEDTQLDFILDVMRGKRALPKKPRGLVQFLRDSGGLQDQGGNLTKGLGISPRTLPGLINNSSGMTLDDAGLRAFEIGFFRERPTISELMEAMDGDLRGTRPMIEPGEAPAAEFYDLYWQVDEIITRGEIDFENLSNAEVRAQLQGIVEQRVTRSAEDLAREAVEMQAARADAPEQRTAPGGAGPMAGNINLAHIRSGQDVKRVIEETAKAFEGQLDAARRGTVTNAETRALASDLGMTADDLLKRQKGQAFNAEQAVAARRLLVRSADTVQKLAQVAKGGSDEALAAFQEALTRHVAIQEQVAGLTAEAGRALQAFNIPAQGAVRARVIRDMIERAGGRDSIESVAEKIATLTDEAAINQAARLAFKPGLRDKLFEVWINALLSGPQTHAVNFLSNALTQVWTIPEHMLAAGFGKLRGGTDKVFLREVPARAFGMARGSVDGVVAFGKVLRTGESAFDPLTKIEAVRQRSIGGVSGRLVRAPSTLLQASDDFFKAAAYRAELNSLALRDGIRKGLEGEALARHVDGRLRQPTEEMAEQAIKHARKVTFTSPMGPMASAAAKFFNSFPMGRVILPFIRTPGNIVKFAAERSPLGFLMREVKDDIAKGGAARDLALARIGMGTTVGVAVATMAAEGKISGGGPSDPGAKSLKRASGWQPYSVKIGDKWYSYNRLEPLGLLLGVSADIVEISGHLTDEESEKLGSLIVGAISKNLLSKTWMRGPAELIEALQDPERYGARWLQSIAGTLIPTGVAQVARVQDPVLRSTAPEAIDDPLLAEAQSIINKIKSRLPGYSEELPPVRNVWGEPILLEGGLGPDLISPVYTSTDKHDATTEELLRLKVYPSWLKPEINGVKLTPRQHDRYSEMAGKTAKRALDRVIASEGYGRLPDFQKKELVDRLIKEARAQAKQIMLINEPAILERKTREQLDDLNKKLEELRGDSLSLLGPVVPAAAVIP
jgi:hypothetical protein